MTTVGEFEIGEALGEGTAGTVFRARHRETGEEVALKLLHNANADDEDVQKRFVREMSILERLEHPNVVRMLDCGLHEDDLYYAMEIVEYGTLKEVLAKRSRLPWRDAAECALQIATALDYLHTEGIVHRDLKPGNVFLAADGRLKLGDFGVARDESAVGLTIEGFTVGTARYMAPEQIKGLASIAHAADLYALGCVTYEMLVGRVPFDGVSMMEIFDQHLEAEPRSIREQVPDCPAGLEKVVLAMLAKEPADRPASAAVVVEELQQILDSPDEQPEPATEEAAGDGPAEPESLTERLVSGPAAEEEKTASWGVVVGVLLALAALIAVAAIANS